MRAPPNNFQTVFSTKISRDVPAEVKVKRVFLVITTAKRGEGIRLTGLDWKLCAVADFQ